MRPLTGLDSSFVSLQTPDHPMHVGGVCLFDASAVHHSFDAVREMISSRLHLVPPFRRRLQRMPLDLERPAWVDVDHVDIDEHLHHAEIPAGSMRDLERFTADVYAQPLDLRKPPWDMTFVDGLADGLVATVTKIHHSAIDGVSGNEITVNLLDLSPEPVVVEPEPFEGERPPGAVDLVRRTVTGLVSRPARLPGIVRRTAGVAAALRERNRAPGVQAPPAPFSAPRTPLGMPLGADRLVAFASIPLDTVKRIREALEVTVNDVLLSLVSGSLRAYLRDRDELPDEPLVAYVPKSVRAQSDRGTGGNQVVVLLCSLATDIAHPIDRLRAIAHSMREAKAQQEVIGAAAFADLFDVLVPGVLSAGARALTRLRLSRWLPPIANVVVSNVPGTPFRLHSLGAPMIGYHPFGPIWDGIGLNATVMRYEDRLDVGLLASPSTVTNLRSIADGLGESLDALADAAGVETRELVTVG